MAQRRLAASLLALVLVTAPALATPLPPIFAVRVTIADPHQAGIPTLVYSQVTYTQGDQAIHQSACLAVLNTYGPPNVGDPYVEIPTQLVWSAFYRYLPHGAQPFDAYSPLNCSLLLGPGDCLKVTGHTGARDVLGQVWIVDALAGCW